MKVRHLRKLLNDTAYIVCKNGDFLCIGSPMVHNILSVNMKAKPEVKYAMDTFQKGKAAVTNPELVWIWDKLEELINSGGIHEIWDNDDEVENPKPVYTVEDGCNRWAWQY